MVSMIVARRGMAKNNNITSDREESKVKQKQLREGDEQRGKSEQV